MRAIQSIQVIPNFHYDVAYLKSYREYLPDCFRIISEALRLLEQHETYRFLIEQTILLEDYVAAYPEQLTRLRRFAMEGRLSVAPGMYVMPDMNHPSGETLFLQIKLGRQWLADNLDFQPTICWIADPWGHHAQLPQILRAAGFTHYVFWRTMRRDVMQNDFLWQGLDGTCIHTHWIARGYSNLVFPTTNDIVNALEMDTTSCSPGAIAAFAESLARYTPDALPTNHVILCNGGDMTFPQASACESLRILNGSGKLPVMTFATPEQALAQIDSQSLPVVKGEFNSSLQGTFTSNIWIKQRSRQLTQQLIAIESFAATHRPEVSVEHDMLWKPLLKQQFHDIICGSITDAALDDCRREFDTAESQMQGTLAKLCQTGSPALFNALSFTRTELVERDGVLCSVTVPPLSATRLDQATAVSIGESGSPALPHTFTTAFYTATIGVNGYLTSLMLPGGKELLAGEPAEFGALTMQMDYGDLWLNFAGPINGGGAQSALNQNEPDRFDRTTPGDIITGTIRPSIREVRVIQSSPDVCVVQQKGVLGFWRINIPFTTTITLSRHTPRITYETRLTPSGRHFRIRAVFPTTLPNSSRLDEIPYGLQSREAGEHCAQHFIRLNDSASALALLNRGTPGCNAHDGVLMLTLFRSAAMEYKTESVQSYCEGQNFQFDYAIVPHAGNDLVTPLQQGHALNTPLLPVRVEETLSAPLVVIDAANVFATAVRTIPSGLFLRLYESTGQATQVTLALAPRVKHCFVATAMEQPLAPIAIRDGRITIDIRSFECCGLILQLESE